MKFNIHDFAGGILYLSVESTDLIGEISFDVRINNEDVLSICKTINNTIHVFRLKIPHFGHLSRSLIIQIFEHRDARTSVVATRILTQYPEIVAATRHADGTLLASGDRVQFRLSNFNLDALPMTLRIEYGDRHHDERVINVHDLNKDGLYLAEFVRPSSDAGVDISGIRAILGPLRQEFR
jgi:hypothetical protein